jgi:hypothetical protein
MIAIVSITPDDTSFSELLDTWDIHEARREVRRLERLGHTHFQVVVMPIQGG